ncbi:hypothetical protein AKJ52_00390 [candidate division MSBL1 archaeon SCGC-AAA382C18]|uniref:Uncharacterized protein n=1 Tax=candidate division MSBL1 archaeon SCGC-AAA382C18 TaxID=1698281 RepID=A0A133VLR6_9EURY|nr:hypothetical protein AKJ52_00390 [candidate division MSBL1 archaeon SCGC-AAA382C18]
MKKMQRRRLVMIRDWEEYNEELVKRGEFYLSPDFLESWGDELEEMNDGKVGAFTSFQKAMSSSPLCGTSFFTCRIDSSKVL